MQPLWRTVWRFLRKLKIELPNDPGISFMGIYPDKTVIQKDTCIPMFIAALFTIARTQKPKCPATEVWIKTTWHIYTVEQYSGLKKNGITPSAITWLQLEMIILSEGRQKE